MLMMSTTKSSSSSEGSPLSRRESFERFMIPRAGALFAEFARAAATWPGSALRRSRWARGDGQELFTLRCIRLNMGSHWRCL
jgi:hypothetical protein